MVCQTEVLKITTLIVKCKINVLIHSCSFFTAIFAITATHFFHIYDPGKIMFAIYFVNATTRYLTDELHILKSHVTVSYFLHCKLTNFHYDVARFWHQCQKVNIRSQM